MGRTGSALVDVHVHLYPDEAAGREAKEGYEIWEYGDYPHVEFDTTAGLISDVGDRYDTAGFDHAVVLQLFDVGRERTRLLSQLRGADPAAKRRECEATLEEALASGLMDANRWVLSQVTTHPGLSAYVCIDPVLLTPALIEGHLREMATLGARGVKLHPVSTCGSAASRCQTRAWTCCTACAPSSASWSCPTRDRDITAAPPPGPASSGP